jgi:hypothetical protein
MPQSAILLLLSTFSSLKIRPWRIHFTYTAWLTSHQQQQQSCYCYLANRCNAAGRLFTQLPWSNAWSHDLINTDGYISNSNVRAFLSEALAPGKVAVQQHIVLDTLFYSNNCESLSFAVRSLLLFTLLSGRNLQWCFNCAQGYLPKDSSWIHHIQKLALDEWRSPWSLSVRDNKTLTKDDLLDLFVFISIL